ncbi:sensor histidine kinase [Planotetraspora phitsanulokensis]|nr:nitrate- and nitrite sensing domain-containing protein [Planotetraspora phitsanulokensis]
MAGRKRSIRFKIFAILLVPLTALAVIWGFAATLTVQSGLELLKIQTVYDNVVVPTRTLLGDIQQERLLSAAYLGRKSSVRDELDAQRKRTDASVEELARVSQNAQDETPPAMWQRIEELIGQVRKFDALRGRVDDHGLSRLEAIEDYSAVAEVGFQAYDRLMISPDMDLIEQTKAIILIGRSREVMSQESALITGVLAIGRISPDERDAFAKMVGQRRLLYQLGTSQLDAELIKGFAAVNASPAYASFMSMENEIMVGVQPNTRLPRDADVWHTTTEGLVATFSQISGDGSKAIADRALPLAKGALYRIGIAGALGLIAVIATLFISVRFARGLTTELVGLRRAAHELADRRLPAIVQRLRRGEDVDVVAETPPIVTRGDTAEVVEVGNAFTSVQHTAVEAAVGQAELRKGVGNVFLNLARRSQSLLQRQLALLDELEQQVPDPDTMEKLFAVDHLTTRMRRHAEGLIILSGAHPGRGWRNPVSLFDVARAAVEEVEDYLRVSVVVPQGPAVIGGSVTDLVHLLAELVENATIFSPPHTQVIVRGEVVARGFAVEIEDRGLGISPEELAQLNERLADPPEFDLADSDRLGLFVVGLLARRHGVRVSLRSSPYGGTSAVVLLPKEIVVENAGDEHSVERLIPPRPPAPPVLALTPPAADAAVDTSADPAGDSLPRRVRQENLAPQLREEPRDVFGSFQAGWQRAQEES